MDEALDKLEKQDEMAAHRVSLRFFAGVPKAEEQSSSDYPSPNSDRFEARAPRCRN